MAVERVAVVRPDAGAPATARLARYAVAGFCRLGIEARLFPDSDSVPGYRPDFVLVLTADEPKLTPFPTYGLLTSPWLDYQTPRLLRNVLSWDAYLTASGRVREWIQDVCFGVRKHAPVAFLAAGPGRVPHSPAVHPCRRLACVPGEQPAEEIVARLSTRDYFTPLPAGIEEPAATLAVEGAGLCLDTPGAIADGQPSLALLETIASGALALATANPFTERWFGDAVLYVHGDAPADVVAWQIDRHLAWMAAHPRDADALAARAREVFESRLALDVTLPAVLALHERVIAEKGYTAAAAPPEARPAPTVGYIVRTSGSPGRVLGSLRAQQYDGLRVFMVPLSPSIDVSRHAEAFADLAPALLPAPAAVPGAEAPEGGADTACAALWTGLRAVRESGCDLFGILDDSDELFPNHVRTLVRTLDNLENRTWFGSFGLAYSAAVERARDLFAGDRLKGDGASTNPVKRRMRHFRFYHPGFLDDGAHEVAPGALLARTTLLDEEVLTDPGLYRDAESYLQLLLAEKTLFAFSCEVTALAHDRPDDAGDSRQVAPIDEARRRTLLRTYGRLFPNASMYLQHGALVTVFDHDLLAPVIVAGRTRRPQPARPLDLEPLGGAVGAGPFVRVNGRQPSGAALGVAALSSGRYRVRCYFSEGDAPDVHAVPFGLTARPVGARADVIHGRLISARRLFAASVAEFEIAIPQGAAARPFDLRIEAHDGGGFDLLGVTMDRLARILRCSILDLPPDRPVWLYGAGEGGRRAKRKLELHGIPIAGFVDRSKRGHLEGVTIIDLESARTRIGPDATLIISSMFWEDIRGDVEAAGIATNLYSLYPASGNTLYLLN